MALACAPGLLFFAAPSAAQAHKIGVLMLHGKSPGSARDPNFGALRSRFEREGMLVEMPDMPWSRFRYIDGHWDKAMAEIAGHVAALRAKGATWIAVVGHSMGCPAAMSHAARGGEVQALGLLAPGHVPLGYFTSPRLRPVRESIEEARALVAAGKTADTQRFNDINQGRPQTVVMTPTDYLSYFDPASDAEMSVTAPRIPARVPVFVAIGDRDPLYANIRGYFIDRLPANPGHAFVQLSADHLSTPSAAEDALVAWLRKSAGQ